jgi:ribosome biogenesis GTPase
VTQSDYGDLDDHSRFDRPRRRTRPRTKDRPSYDDAARGFVVTIDRGRYTTRVDDDESAHIVTAMKARALGRQGVVVGDRVRLVGDTSGEPGTLARIVEVEPRRTVLRRTADDTDPVERIVVANAEQLAVVTAVANPEPRPRLIDRALVAAFDAGLEPLLFLTKTDLASPDALVAAYEPLGVPSVIATRGTDLADVRAALADRVSVLVGHSGVGKSTLVNALVPGAGRAIGDVNVVTGRGRHTSTSAIALELPFGGWVVDTPGIRSFGLAHVEPQHLIHAFEDLDEVTADCPRGCTHAASEPECALDDAVADGRVSAERVQSFRRLLSSREGGDVD